MKKIVRLTESDLTRLVKRVINEQLMNYAKLKNNAAWEVVKRSLKMNGFNPSNLKVMSSGDGRQGNYQVITSSNLDTLIGYRLDFGKNNNGSDVVDIFKFVTKICTSSSNCSQKNFAQILKKYPIANQMDADPLGFSRENKKNPHYILFTSSSDFDLGISVAFGGDDYQNRHVGSMHSPKVTDDSNIRDLLNMSIYKLIGQASVQDLEEIKKFIK